MNSCLFSKIKIFVGLTLLMLLVAPIPKNLAEDRKIFSDDDLNSYQYGNGEVESNTAEKNIAKDTAKSKRPYSDITATIYMTTW